jgi:hypothetical protein
MPRELEVTQEVTRVPLQIKNYLEEINLDVFKKASHNIILGLP